MHSTLKLTLFGLVLVAATALVTAGILNAAAPQEEPDMEAVMKAYKEAAKPGEPHHALMKSVGAWDVATKYFMGDKVQESKATADFESLFGGRFLVQRHHGNMGPENKFEGFQILGYDNITKQYQSVWLDDWSTGIHTSKGQLDENGCVKLEGTMKDAMTPKGRSFKITWMPEGDDKFTIVFHEGFQGKEMKTMEMVYTRKK